MSFHVCRVYCISNLTLLTCLAPARYRLYSCIHTFLPTDTLYRTHEVHQAACMLPLLLDCTTGRHIRFLHVHAPSRLNKCVHAVAAAVCRGRLRRLRAGRMVLLVSATALKQKRQSRSACQPCTNIHTWNTCSTLNDCFIRSTMVSVLGCRFPTQFGRS